MNNNRSHRVGILGATGYTGVEIVRLLLNHPKVEISCLTSDRSAGQRFSDIFPAFQRRCDLVLTKLHSKEIARQTTFIFSCLPHQNSMLHVPTLLEYGCKVVDLSADFRLDSAQTFQEWYGPHTAPDYLQNKVYGLPEIYRHQIKENFLVANPGCYPTATILGLAPLLEEKLIAPEGIICDAKSGTSGSGRKPQQTTVFSEVNESLKAYGVEKHRHTPEIEQELSKLAGKDIKIRFIPHLIPIDRGLFATIYARPLKKLTTTELLRIYRMFYKVEPFIRILDEGQLPNTKHVRGTNYCDISVFHDERAPMITILVAIDNLNKGAAGQAVQNMNIMNGFEETMGLLETALIP